MNGTPDPHFVLRRRRTRLGIPNASNSRIFALARDDGMDLVIIGSDGSLLERPMQQRRVRVGPGERIELLVDAQFWRMPGPTSHPDRVARRIGTGQEVRWPVIPRPSPSLSCALARAIHAFDAIYVRG